MKRKLSIRIFPSGAWRNAASPCTCKTDIAKRSNSYARSRFRQNARGFIKSLRMALGESEEAQKLARAALALQPDLSTKYVREQEWYRDDTVLEKLIHRLIEAGVPEQC